MKKIGFIDYYLDEWHANNYPNWLRENIADNKRDIQVSYAWADIEISGKIGTSEWCKKNEVIALSSSEELVSKSDCLIVLAPDNPEQHEKLARLPLMSGKPVFIDKTFSPDLASGIRMFDLAEKHGTPMFSSSALRFTKELSGFPNDNINQKTIEYVSTTGPGKYDIYIVHQLEMIVSLMGAGAKKIKSLSTYNERLIVIDYEDGRRASMTQAFRLPFQISIQTRDEKGIFINNCSDIFLRQINAILDFFETGKSLVPREETLEVMAIREAGYQALNCDDTWVTIPKF